MKHVQFVAAATLAGLISVAFDAEAACKSKYYTGKDIDPVWWQGRDNARSNWSDKVHDALGLKWSKWSKARHANDTCDWLPTQGVNYCIAKAQPCKN